MCAPQEKADIIFVNIDSWMPNNSGLAVLDPYLKQHGINSIIISSSELDHYIDQADVFGFSVLNYVYATAQELTQRLSQKTIIWGGWAATSDPEMMLRENPNVDYVILREGEKRLLNLLRSFKQPELFDAIDGIAYRDSQRGIIVRPPTEFVDLDELPRPNTLVVVQGIVFIELTRGCYGRCYYCQDVATMRFKSAKKAADEIEAWYREGYDTFHLGNANAAANGQLLQELFSELETRKLPVHISIVGRPEDFLRNAAVMEYLFRSEIIRPCAIEMGVEGNTQHLLNLLGRRTTPEKNAQALTTMMRLRERYAPDVKILAYMILFSHYDMTLEDFVENVKFIGQYQCSQSVISLYLVGLRNTGIWHEMQTRGMIKSDKERLQILRYSFNDPVVDSLCRKLVRLPQKRWFDQQKLHTHAGSLEFQESIYRKILEFYHSGDIMQSVQEFLDAPEEDNNP
ncbi:radical SAM domain protein [Candidatus Moduliflexus flocculans]|uniref:Radical SAM domain protein n=1 Tax=Candidatus Moduliflexus flocculans TaxID=1499966 RepID=A0A081BM50_9BACT|nr:radical SAM domain protein [Candidatus Moduliflexus flocculans]